MIIQTIVFTTFSILLIGLLIFVTVKATKPLHKVLIIFGFLVGIAVISLLNTHSQVRNDVNNDVTDNVTDNGNIIVVAPELVEIPDYDIAIQTQVKKLRLGQIVFTVPKEMQLGRNELVRVRISDDLRKNLKAELKGHPETAKLDVSSLLQVKLSGTSFNIQSQTEEQQVLKKDGLAEWIWSVTPQERGEQELFLIVYALIELPNKSEQKIQLKTFERTIKVSVSPNYWVENNWKWIVENWEAVTAIFTAFSVFALAKWKQIITLIKNCFRKPIS
ncbi:hypothetical protein [Anabaena azotica]|uniref:Uncharacterized protein n=1 Tax=Anabaena azotica FACHB-119 TaxID=947527 RepID=A0ABR8DHS8_9NOST|nr:hypothetical protein [Anabaena azotica]MBD2505313.1 hypothetical protein [Anabaena azotica FACHB-119]